MKYPHRAPYLRRIHANLVSPQMLGPLVKRFTNSTAVWIAMLICAFDLALRLIGPLQYIDMGFYQPDDGNPTYRKMVSLSSPLTKFDVLILGSSLARHMTLYADIDESRVDGENQNKYAYLNYTRGQYLEKMLTQVVGYTPKVFNFGLNAAMPADNLLFLSKVIALGHRPKLAIFCLAPRDFINNKAESGGESPYYQFFSTHPQFSTLDITKVKPTKLGDHLLERYWHYFRIRRDYNTLLTQLACTWFNRASTLYLSTQAQGKAFGNYLTRPLAKQDRLEAIRQNLIDYQTIYNPPDKLHRLPKEFHYLNQALALCQQNNILPVIVNMPLMEANYKLIQPALYRSYIQGLEQASQVHGAVFIDFNGTGKFADNDFWDSVHANTQGARKICRLLSESLSRNQIFLSAIATPEPTLHAAGLTKQQQTN